MQKYEIMVRESLKDIAPAQWNALTHNNPTLSYAWLHALHESGSACADTGWLPQYLTVHDGDTLVGAMPLYMKGHSYGEYVFDWAWADAYARTGREYYPKLLSAIPFTPCTGARALAATPELEALLIEAALQIAKQSKVSSLHILFAPDTQQAKFVEAGLLTRTAVQFHWRNAGYANFDALLATFSKDKRKKIKQERRKVADAGITLRRVVGAEISEADWDFFVACYNRTYREHRSTPYLNREFFRMIARDMGDNCLLVIAEKEDASRSPILPMKGHSTTSSSPRGHLQPMVRVACAFNLFNEDTLYGRYWGCTEFNSGLHFETCYYQALEFCIERGIQLFEGGAQGEHKLARGFTPVKCNSAHWIADPQLRKAIAHFLTQEGASLENYVDELAEHEPYKQRSTLSL